MAKKNNKTTKQTSKGKANARAKQESQVPQDLETTPATTSPETPTTTPTDATVETAEPTAETAPLPEAAAAAGETVATAETESQVETMQPASTEAQAETPPTTELSPIEQAIARSNTAEDCQEIYGQYLDYLKDKPADYAGEFERMVLSGEVRLYLDENRMLRDAHNPKAETTTLPEAAPKTKPAKAKAESKAGPKKLSAIDAAAQVLAQAGQAMNCQELIKAMADQGLWTSPGGRTPAATLYSAILREISTKGASARFMKTERGKFAAKA